MLFQGNCYFMLKTDPGTSGVSFADAKKGCQDRNAKLAEIESEEEMVFIGNNAKYWAGNMITDIQSAFWIGEICV